MESIENNKLSSAEEDVPAQNHVSKEPMVNAEDRDLTDDDKDLTNEQLVPKKQDLEPYNAAKAQEQVRGHIAQGLIWLLAVIILFAFISLWIFSSKFDDLEKLMTIIFSPVIALVGSATGYYFGGKNGQ